MYQRKLVSWPRPFGSAVNIVIVLFRPIFRQPAQLGRDFAQPPGQRVASWCFDLFDTHARAIRPGGFRRQLDDAALDGSGVTHASKLPPGSHGCKLSQINAKTQRRAPTERGL